MPGLANARFLVDTSVLARLRKPEVSQAVAPLLRSAECAISSLIEMEFCFSASSPGELLTWRYQLSSLPRVETTQEDFDRGLAVMQVLAGQGKHRAVGLADLIIAAAAERTGLTLLHYDSDFDHIAQVTGQLSRWAVKRGSVS